jgi:hypothetical protein
MTIISRRRALAGFAATSIFDTSHAAITNTFRAFDGLLHSSKPASRLLGLEPIVAVSNIWRLSSQQQHVDEHGIITALSRLPNGTEHIFFDIECWPLLHVPQATRDESILKFMKVAEITRSFNPSLKFGFYNILPAHTYWPLVTSQFNDEYDEWRDANNALVPLGRMVDYVFPSLYTYYADRSGWIKHCEKSLDAARVFAKPVLPFLWFEYHDSNRELRNREVESLAWQEELQFCRRSADGVVLWGGYQRNWSEKANWWRLAKSELGIHPL